MPSGIYVRTDKIKTSLSAARKKNWQDPNCKYNSEEFREKQHLLHLGEKNHNYNKPATEERKRKQQISMKKIRADPNSIYNSISWRNKISKQHNDLNSIYQSIEYKQKISKANTGKVHSIEARERHRNARMKQILPQKDSIPEKLVQEELSKRNIVFEKHVKLLGQPDIFIKPNICIFCDGDYFHANPNKYESEHIMWKKKNILAKDIWKKDWNVTLKLTEKNYFVMRFWETDILKDIKSIGNTIEKLI